MLPATIGLLWLAFARRRDRLGFSLSRRGCLVAAWLAFEALVVIISESTSVGRHLTTGVVAGAWLLVLVALAVVLRDDVRRSAQTARAWLRDDGWRWWRDLGIDERAGLGVVVAIIVVLGVTTSLYPPNNTDAMAYHLARVAHWIQDRSVAPFATHFLAQVELGPLAEYTLTQLHLLAGTDRLDGFVQLSAMVICVVGASELARLLGASRRTQILAAVVAATVPSALLEAGSTQNNLVAAAAGIGLLVLALAWRPGHRLRQAAALGVAGGLVVLAKGTLVGLLAPAALLLGARILSRELRGATPSAAARRGVLLVGVAAVAALSVAGPFLARNVDLFGGPSGPVSESTIDAHWTPAAGAANVVRSVASNFWIGGGSTGFNTEVSTRALGALRRVYDLLGVGSSDPRYVTVGTASNAFEHQPYFGLLARIEDFGANPWHLVLIVATASFLAVGVARRDRRLRDAALLGAGLAAGFVVFTGTARWSPVTLRYQVPLLLAWSALIALAVARLPRVVAVLVAAGLVVGATPALLDNASRSLLHPGYHYTSFVEPYFIDVQLNHRSAEAEAVVTGYETVVTALAESSCHQLGVTDRITREYPLWAGLAHLGWPGTIAHVRVTNATRRLEPAGFKPCARLSGTGAGPIPPEDGTIHVPGDVLDLSLDPSRAATVRATVPGFASRVPGVHVLPGGGWSIASSQPPVLVGTAGLYLSSAAASDVTIRFDGVTSTLPLYALPTGAPTVTATRGAGGATIRVHLARGVTGIRLVAGDGESSSRLPTRQVVVTAGP